MTFVGLSAGTDDSKVALINVSGVEPLVELVRYGMDGQKSAAAQALSNLATARGETIVTVKIDASVIQSVVQLLRGAADDQTKLRLSHVVANLAYKNAERQDAIARAGTLGPLVRLLRVGSDGQSTRALTAVGNLACKHLANQDMVAAAGLVPIIVDFLRGGRVSARRKPDAGGDSASANEAN